VVLALVLAACGAGQRVEDLQRSPLSVKTTATYDRDDLYRFFIVAFGAAPGVTYMGQLLQAADSGLSMQQIANILTTKPAFLEVYPQSLSHQGFAQQLVDNLVGTSASPAAKAEAVADIATVLLPISRQSCRRRSTGPAATSSTRSSATWRRRRQPT
jgi:hypothetical protein